MKKTLKLFLALIVILTLALALVLLTGCDASETGLGEPQEKTLVVGLSAEPVTLDPHQMQDYNSMRVGCNIYNNLVEYKDSNTEIQPGLAISWDVLEEGLEYIFHLRTGVLFQDGTPFNAEAVRFSLERPIKPEQPPAPGETYPFAEYALGMIDTVQVEDEYTVKIKLKEKHAPFLTYLAMPVASIVSPAAVQKNGQDFTHQPVGTGPYQLASWKIGDELVLEKNPHYWGWENRADAGMDKLVFRSVLSDEDRISALEEGYVDLIADVPLDSLTRLKGNKNIHVARQAGLEVWYAAFNCQRKPFRDERVRQAFNYAINKKALVENIWSGAAQLAEGTLPPTVWGYGAMLEKYPYDPERANALLVQAGYPQGLTVHYVVPKASPLMPHSEQMAQAIQSDLAKIGVVMKIEALEWEAFLDRVFMPVHLSTVEMHQMVWVSNSGDPDDFLFPLLSSSQWPAAGFNSAYYRDQKVDQLLNEARILSGQKQREPLYQQAQQIIMEQSPWVVLGCENQIVALNKKIKGFQPHPTGFLRLNGVEME